MPSKHPKKPTPEKQREYNANYARKYPERVKASKLKYQLANKEKIKLYAKLRAREKAAIVNNEKRRWEAAHPEMVAMQRVRRRIKRMNGVLGRFLQFHYEITLDAYREVEELQNGVCAICCQPARLNMRARRLFVDHNHKTGRIRGLLCHHCNAALGYLHEDAELFGRAVLYLEAFGEQSDDDWVSRVRRALDHISEKRGTPVRYEVLAPSFAGRAHRGYPSATATHPQVASGATRNSIYSELF